MQRLFSDERMAAFVLAVARTRATFLLCRDNVLNDALPFDATLLLLKCGRTVRFAMENLPADANRIERSLLTEFENTQKLYRERGTFVALYKMSRARLHIRR